MSIKNFGVNDARKLSVLLHKHALMKQETSCTGLLGDTGNLKCVGIENVDPSYFEIFGFNVS